MRVQQSVPVRNSKQEKFEKVTERRRQRQAGEPAGSRRGAFFSSSYGRIAPRIGHMAAAPGGNARKPPLWPT